MTHTAITQITALLQVSLENMLAESPDPLAATEHWRAEMRRGLTQAEDAVAAAVTQERRIEQERQSALASMAEWDVKVDDALRGGDEIQARAALERQRSYESIARAREQELEQHRKVMADMKAALKALRDKVQDLDPPSRPRESVA